MNEQDYIIATNLAKVRAAKSILNATIEGFHLGITDAEAQQLKEILYRLENRLAGMVNITEEPA